jgi:hypothetical protein
MRTAILILAAIIAAAPAAAQQPTTSASAGRLPAGWSVRVDRDRPADDVAFTTMGDGFHATTGPAAVFYDPDWTRSGEYRVSARFTQTRAPAHPEAYGIVIGGTIMDGPDQAYSYFLVRGTGEYFIATRTGAERTVVVPWTPHEAIAPQDEQGRQVNVLGIRVDGDEVVFTANGREVARRPAREIRTDGVVGFRVNHRLDVHIDQVSR